MKTCLQHACRVHNISMLQKTLLNNLLINLRREFTQKFSYPIQQVCQFKCNLFIFHKYYIIDSHKRRVMKPRLVQLSKFSYPIITIIYKQHTYESTVQVGAYSAKWLHRLAITQVWPLEVLTSLETHFLPCNVTGQLEGL